MIDMGKLILVGAGPGDPELITLKGLNAIRKADVILYDALVDKRLLENARQDAQKVFVGKRGYEKSVSQEKINKMCVDYAKENDIVIRLKGGDPYIFGRGNEEVSYATDNNIPCEVIPGLSSATALATLLGIPLTLRGVTRGFSVVSAVNKDGNLSLELMDAIKKDMTLVILMGLKRLDEICELYRQAAKSTLPVAIVQNGSLDNEKRIIGIVDDIEIKAANEDLQPPAIIITGEVINFRVQKNGVNNG